jgi:hypothetical protein
MLAHCEIVTYESQTTTVLVTIAIGTRRCARIFRIGWLFDRGGGRCDWGYNATVKASALLQKKPAAIFGQVAKCAMLDELPERRSMSPKSTTPRKYKSYLANGGPRVFGPRVTCWRRPKSLVMPAA